MAKKTERSLRLSAQGIEKANTALTKFGSVADLAAQIGATRKRTKGASPKTTVGMSRATIYNFLNGEPVQRKEFHEICKKLGLKWQEIVDLPGINEPESAEKEQEQGNDIDELVREVRSRCCDKILHLYSKIQLLNRQQIDVDKLYVDVYVLEKLSSESYAKIHDLLKGSDLRDGFDRLGLGRREKRSPGFEIAAHHPRLMILGKPGSGKTTFLRHLAIACCKGEFLADYIPILIELRGINASEFNLFNSIRQEFDLPNEEQTQQILKQGKVLLLLDGLDEVPGQSIRDVQDHIYKFSQQYYKNRFILTCRTQTTEYTLSTFDYVEVAEFKPEQVEIFAQNWFTALAETPERGAELTVKFLGKLRLPENKQTAELALTPILLSLTCWVFDDLKDLPPKRSDLYEQGINLLLEKWDEKRGVRRDLGSEAYRKLSIGEKKKLLSYLAARKFEQEQYVLFEQGELQRYIAEYLGISTEDTEAVLDAVAAQHGLLIERAQGFWSFSHLTFQEYFTAKWFCDHLNLQSLVTQTHITDKKWREVFLLLVNLTSHTDELLLSMREKVDEFVMNEKLQLFLKWIYGRANKVQQESKIQFKLAVIRAYYLHIPYSDSEIDLYLAISLEPKVNQHPSLRLDSALTKTLDSFYGFIDGYSDPISTIEWLTMALDVLNNDNLNLQKSLHEKLLTELKNIMEELPPELKQVSEYRRKSVMQRMQQHSKPLQKLEKHTPNPDISRTRLLEWWLSKGQDWVYKLRGVMINYRNIGHEFWQFSEQQQKMLYQYHQANRLLVDCLTSSCAIAKKVKDDIEKTLFLPINENKKRQQQI